MQQIQHTIDNLIGTHRAAEILGITPDMLRRMRREAKVSAVIIPETKQWLFDRREILALAQSRAANPHRSDGRQMSRGAKKKAK